MAKKRLDDKTSQNDDASRNIGEFSPTEDEPNFSDPEDYVDDITDEGMCIVVKFSIQHGCTSQI